MKQFNGPDGKTYQFPDDMSEDDIKGVFRRKFANPTNTRGGDLLRGLEHGASMGYLGNPPEENATGWRKAGEIAGGVAPAWAANLIPGGPLVKGAIGAGVGAMQPASGLTERAENMAIGAGSSLVGQGASRLISSRVKSLNDLSNELIGMGLGASHAGPFGTFGGAGLGHFLGRNVERIAGGGLADLVNYIAKSPGLAAYLGIQSWPYLEQGGKAAGDYLGQPSQ